MTSVQKLNYLYQKVFNQKIDLYSMFDEIESSGLKDDMFKEISQFPYFTFDGRMDDILLSVIYYKGLKDLTQFESFDDFMHLIDIELKKEYVPNILIFPINVVRKSKEFDKIDFENDNIKIFPIYDDKSVFSKKNNKIDEYIEQNVYMKLLPQHIKTTKDSLFFNYPLMTILFNGIDYNIVKESPKIIEAVSSIIRMSTYKKSIKTDYLKFSQIVPLGTTYAVYYNKPGTSNKPPYSNGYGYSHRTSFYNILDVSIDEIEENKLEISNQITKLLEALFGSDRYNDNIKYSVNQKWINSLFIFNEAYELASRENYDVANIMLLTVLETLYLPKNSKGSKSDKIIEKISPKIKETVSEQALIRLIKTTYRMRNDFVHEGKRIKNIGRSFLDLTALIGGLEPLVCVNSDFGQENDNLEYLNSLFKLAILCIMNQ